MKSALNTILTAAFVSALSALFLEAYLPSELSAHSVFTFAYTQGNQVCTESYFSTRKDIVKDGTISMFGSDGKLIAKSQTDDKGAHCFALPNPLQDVKFVIEAGEGHIGEFSLRKEDLIEESKNLPPGTGAAP
jgi:hypothetical protein